MITSGLNNGLQNIYIKFILYQTSSVEGFDNMVIHE